jgi:hypothetical protein
MQHIKNDLGQVPKAPLGGSPTDLQYISEEPQ